MPMRTSPAARVMCSLGNRNARAAWPDNHVIGKAAYEQMLREEQLLPFDAADIERMARDELAHGWAEEAWLRSVSTHRKIPFGAASGGGMAPSGPALVGYYRDRIAELHAFVRERDVVTVPDWLGAMEIVETPAFLQPVSPGASMRAPRRFATATTGYYFITPPPSLAEAAERLDMNQDFDRDRIWSTAAHEAMPGHFLQLSIARRHPNFVRRILDDSCLAEGWAFYGEEMFVRLGLYGDGLDARLFTARWERVRGVRAIVDPKLASGEWTIAQAVDFFVAQSGFTRSASEAAVDGIALDPGYVISYTVGPVPAADAARRVPGAHRRARLAARLPRSPALLRPGRLRRPRPGAARRPRQAGERGARRRELLSVPAPTDRDRRHLPRRCRGASSLRASADSVSVMTR
jgi:hypothetical protein